MATPCSGPSSGVCGPWERREAGAASEGAGSADAARVGNRINGIEQETFLRSGTDDDMGRPLVPQGGGHICREAELRQGEEPAEETGHSCAIDQDRGAATGEMEHAV